MTFKNTRIALFAICVLTKRFGGGAIMSIGLVIFGYTIDFWEMLTSCLLALGIFQKEIRNKKDICLFLLFSASGTVLLKFRANGMLPVPDWVPSVVIFTLYSLLICKAKIWAAALWALFNYLMIGIVSISMCSVLSFVTNTPMNMLHQTTDKHIIVCVLVRLGQLFVVEVIRRIIRKRENPLVLQQKDMGLLGISVLSVAVLMFLWNAGSYITEETVPYVSIAICLFILILNFVLLFLKEILSREKYNNKELQEQNRIISMQIRNQNEISEMYNKMRSLKHDMNNHLHTISGYIQTNDYEKAEDYIKKIVGEISISQEYQSGNPEIDALIGSKSAWAKKNNIRLNIDISVPSTLQIAAEHLSIVLGNLYDNAIDANLKIEELPKRYIDIKILLKDSDLLLYFENAALEEDKNDKFHWTTTKKSTFEHGFGLKNIDRIVRLYNGFCYRELKNKVFVCHIRIPNGKD